MKNINPKKYLVYVREIYIVPVEVLAESEEEARCKAMERLESGDIDDLEYSHTADSDEWTCEEIE